MKSKKILVPILLSLAFSLCFFNCDGQKNNTNNDASGITNDQIPPATSTAKKDANGNAVTVDKFKFILPENWTGDTETQIWHPEGESTNAALPPHSLHHGARPLMGISSLEEGIKRHIGTQPMNIKRTSIGGLKGIICEWQRMSYKSTALFILEKNAGMDIMYFFTCQAPVGSFDQYTKTYRAILNSVTL